MATVVPSSLSKIDAVEVVDLRGLDADRVSEYMAIAKSARHVRVVGRLADRFAELWRSLPEGEQSRCHIPPFGLRFINGLELVCEASICWECNNIHGKAGGEKVFFQFDGEHEIALELLKECKLSLGDVLPS